MASALVPAGAPCPVEVETLWRAGGDYAIAIDFGEPAAHRRWSDDRKGEARRIADAAPLFEDELVERALVARPDYFEGRATR